MIFGTLAWTIELYMTKYILIGEIFSSGGATLYKNPSDQTVYDIIKYILAYIYLNPTCILDSGHLTKALNVLECAFNLLTIVLYMYMGWDV